MKTYNISNNGRPVKNQFVKIFEDKEVFQSYQTNIAEVKGGIITLDTNALNYSKTTSKYLYIYLKKTRKEIEKEIEAGLIKVSNLN
jgi:hypothetical protein